MKDLENKKALNEAEEETVSGGIFVLKPKQPGKEYVSHHFPLFNPGEPMPPSNPPSDESGDGGATGGW